MQTTHEERMWLDGWADASGDPVANEIIGRLILDAESRQNDRARANNLAEALKALLAVQNGPPLKREKDAWHGAITQAEEALANENNHEFATWDEVRKRNSDNPFTQLQIIEEKCAQAGVGIAHQVNVIRQTLQAQHDLLEQIASLIPPPNDHWRGLINRARKLTEEDEQ